MKDSVQQNPTATRTTTTTKWYGKDWKYKKENSIDYANEEMAMAERGRNDDDGGTANDEDEQTMNDAKFSLRKLKSSFL